MHGRMIHGVGRSVGRRRVLFWGDVEAPLQRPAVDVPVKAGVGREVREAPEVVEAASELPGAEVGVLGKPPGELVGLDVAHLQAQGVRATSISSGPLRVASPGGICPRTLFSAICRRSGLLVKKRWFHCI